MSKSKIILQDLLDKCDKSTLISKEEQEWDQMPPVGKEYGSDDELNLEDEKIEDIELVSKFEQRKSQPEIEINIDDL